MPANANTVNIKKPKRAYHHGDLRAALISAGLGLLSEGTAETLSLREVARRAGVSPTAVYRHFPDKQALLYALCQHGGQALAQAQGAAQAAVRQAGGDGHAAFAASGQAYVRFALANPALFRLLMATQPPRGHFGADAAKASQAMRLLQDNIGALLPPGAPPAAQRIAAVHAWSTVHGMAMLMLDGQIPPDEALITSISSGLAAPPS